MTLIIFQAVLATISALILVLMIRAFLRGSNYIAASNMHWSDRTLTHVFGGSKFQRYTFKATPLLFMFLSVWTGYSLFYSFFWFLGDKGYIHREYEEWTTYRHTAAVLIGGGLGFGFCSWLLDLCERAIPQGNSEQTSEIEQLKRLLGTEE